MNCELCKKPIEKYNEKFNTLKLDNFKSVDICSPCSEKFLKWQQGIYADLFPTKSMKKAYGKKEYKLD